MKQVAWVGALSVLVLSACTGDEPLEPGASATSSLSGAASTQQSATPAETSPEDTAIVVVPVEPAEPSVTAEPGWSERVPNEALAAEMVCEPISRATRLSHESRWGPVDWDEAVQIAVGEGLTAGINWWVVVATPDGATGRARLTNADSLDNPADAQWLIASDSQASYTGESTASNEFFYWKYFPHVKWDSAGHERLYAAVAKGFECLDLEYPEPDPLNG